MGEQTQVQQVTMKDSKKVEMGKRLAEYNRRKREKLAKAQSELQLTSGQHYGTGAIVAIGALGVLGYCVYQFKKGEPKEGQPKETPVREFEWSR